AVLDGMGVFKGYEDGSFKPENKITRAEVATIIYRIYTADVAKNDKSGMYATYNKFSDMAGAGWAAGYIGYCANAEFVKGYPDGTFKPSGNVTGYEVLAMILRAVGYDKNNEFTGADWALNVAKYAEQLGILKNVAKTTDLSAPATRELVAEILFRAIQSPMVTYTAAFGYQNVGLNGDKDGKIFQNNVSIGMKNFGLDYTNTENDIWGRPTKVWFDATDTKDGKYKDGTSTVYATIAATPDATFNVATSECDICEALGVKKTTTIVEKYTNGTPDLKYNKDIVATVTKATLGEQGQQIEFYEVKGGYRMVVIDTYLAYVNEVVAEKTDTKGHVVRDAYLALDGFTTKAANSTDSAKIEPLYVKGNDYAEGDWLLVNVNEVDTTKIVLTSNKKAEPVKTVEVVGKADSFVGAQTEVYYKSNQHTIDKKDYNDAYTFYLNEAGMDGTVNFTWFLDQFGNLIGDIAIDNTNYAVLKNINWETGKPGYAEATLVYMDGKEETVKVASIDGVDYERACKELCGPFNPMYDNAVPTLSDSENSNKFRNDGEGVYAYMSSDTTYTGNYDGMALFMVETNKDGTVNLQGIDAKNGDEIKTHYVYFLNDATIKTDVGTISVNDNTATNAGKKLALDNNTKFIVREVKDGKYVYTTYTLKTLPDYAAESVTLYYTMSGNFVNRVYIKHAVDQGEFAKYIFVPTNADKYIKRVVGENTWQAYVYINGELKWIETTEKNAKTLAENTGKLFEVKEWDKTSSSEFYGLCKKIDLVNEATDKDAWNAADMSDYVTKWDINADGDTIVSDSIVWRLSDKTRIVTADGVELSMSDLSKISSRDFETKGIWVVSAKADYEGKADYVYVGEKLNDNIEVVGMQYKYDTDKIGYGTFKWDNAKNAYVFETKLNKGEVGVENSATYAAVDLNTNADYDADKLWLSQTHANGEYYVGMHGVACAPLVGANNGYVESVLTAEDGLTTAKYMWKIEDGDAKSNDATLDSVQIDGTDVTIATGRTEPKLESALEVKVKKEFTLTAAATDAANAKVEIGSGDTLENAVKNLSERNSVKVTQSTELNGGFVVIKVTAENGTTVQHYVYKLVLEAPTGN
ncbi:MAG: S-layer homology domain-containing protein, partial [Oscillibacter sp.]|nr:S-layer homology domain-containing protein [Oscillibacter sp.]